jgi:ATP-dependent RNA helicase RhlB
VTAELLTAIPRAPRALPESGAEVDEDAGESIGAIFKEAREQRIADEQRRGGGRTGSSSGGRSGSGPSRGPGAGPRSRPGSADGKPRPPRPPRSETPAVAVSAPVAAAALESAKPEGERAPRKRRRRRHGMPLEGGDAVVAVQQQAATPAQVNAPAPAKDNSSFLTRMGRKLKSLVSG